MATPEIRGSRVLVTGGAGFIGSHVAEALVQDNEVTILDDFSTGKTENVPSGANVVEGSIRNPSVVEDCVDGIDIVYHQAAIVGVDASIEAPRKCHEVNVDGAITILDAARSTDARVVLASSAAIYGQPETVPISETAQKRPTSPYGLDKLAADRFAQLYHSIYGLETVSLRYFNVYGPRQPVGDYSGVIRVFIDNARSGEPIPVHGDGSQTRDFVHISDVVDANIRAGVTDAVGTSFNVGTGVPTSISELAETVASAVDSHPEIVHTDPRPGDITESYADLEKAREGLGFSPSVDLGSGLESLLS